MTSLARRAAAASKRREGELARVRGPAVPGDLIILPSGTTVIHWLIVKTHPDDENLLFAVLADDNPETGPGDLRVPREHPWGPITLRCGFGLWIESELIDPPRRAGLMGEELVGSVRKVLGELAAGTLVPTPEQAVLDQDPDFQEWLDELEKARDAAMAWAEAAGTVCDREQMAEETPPRLLRFIDQLFPSSLAAREGGIRDRPASGTGGRCRKQHPRPHCASRRRRRCSPLDAFRAGPWLVSRGPWGWSHSCVDRRREKASPSAGILRGGIPA